MIEVDNFRWNIWKVNPKTGERLTWLGSIMDPETGFLWLKKQGKKREHFRINNVPPSTSRMQNPPYEVYAPAPNQRERGEDLPKRVIPGKYEFVDEPRRKAKPKRAGITAKTGAQARAKAQRAEPKTAEQIEMQKAAADLYDQHKADEAKELGDEALDG